MATRLSSKLLKTKERLKLAEKHSFSREFLQTQVNDITYKFILSQISQQKVKSKGRRFSLDDKLLALSLWKQSPRGYRLLQKIFALPSRRTLSNVLRKIPLDTGINEVLFCSLKASCQNLDEKDRCCCIVFDEMSIQPNLFFNEASDFVEGFQDMGADERAAIFADKVLVFMARGISKKWKQPLAYYFSEGSMKADFLMNRLKIIVRKVRECGLKVIFFFNDFYKTKYHLVISFKKKLHSFFC